MRLMVILVSYTVAMDGMFAGYANPFVGPTRKFLLHHGFCLSFADRSG